MREGGRLKRERERVRRASKTDVPKLHTYNEYEISVNHQTCIRCLFDKSLFSIVLFIMSKTVSIKDPQKIPNFLSSEDR